MNTQDIRTLRILEEMDNGHAPSQRDLARSLDVSLGLVNSFVKRLAHKGYFKVTTIPKNRVKYILTPQGAAEKARLTMEYIQYSVRFYREAREKTRGLFTRLAASGVRRVVFFGAGEIAEIAYVALKETPIELLAVVSETEAGKTFLGMAVEPLSALESTRFDRIVVTDLARAGEIKEELFKRGFSKDAVISIDAV